MRRVVVRGVGSLLVWVRVRAGGTVNVRARHDEERVDAAVERLQEGESYPVITIGTG